MTTFANAINSTIGASISGVTNTLTVTNPSNTASSGANCLVTVGGGSAADPTHQSVVSGVTTWTWGIDNSDSDAWVLAGSAALGTTNVMRVATTGEINYPLQPAFYARVDPGTAQNNVTGNGTAYTILYPTEIFDSNSDYNAGTSIFTAPVTGHYFLAGGTSLSELAATSTRGWIQITASNRNINWDSKNWANERNDVNEASESVCGYLDMDSADTAKVEVIIYNMGADTVDITVTAPDTCAFQGFLHS